MNLGKILTVQLSILAAVWAGASPGRAQSHVAKTAHGLLLSFDNVRVGIAAVTDQTLRLSVSRNGRPIPAASSFLAAPPTNTGPTAAWQPIQKDRMVGIQTQAGQLLINPANAEWTLEDSQGHPLIPRHAAVDLHHSAASGSNIVVALGWDDSKLIRVYGCGNGVDSLQQSNTTTGVSNGRAVIPYYWSPAGYAVLAVTADDNQPARWQAAANGKYIAWIFPGRTADLYLMPAASLKDAAKALTRLTGHPPVPPRWAFGYLQSRWGWKNRAYIENTLRRFRDLKIPVDAFIYDFEWYTTTPDYKLPPSGKAGFTDFGWNTNLFPHPAEQIRNYQHQGVHFVGIRKPRLGNARTLKMARAKGWLLPANHPEKNKFHSRDVNFANPEFRKWYVAQSAGLLRDGIDGWWNDEGEGTFTTYFYWNRAEEEAFKRYKPQCRLWTLNRAFSPGTQRLGAAAWTGDVKSSWHALATTPVSLLNWSLAGMPYGACDIGGYAGNPSPELLVRWMQAGVFFPVMRSHSDLKSTPRFPWLYGPRALQAIRQAIDLRYRLIPFFYSLAHRTFETGIPLMRPLVMEFPGDPQTANLSNEWMMGSSLLAAPVLQPGGKRPVYLPPGRWYAFQTSHSLSGNRTLEVTAGLDDIPIYVRAGSILPLGPLIQHTSQLPGGPLELQIYPGGNAAFTLVEDDGHTTGYLNGQVRRTTFRWDDAAGRLSWNREGAYAGPDVFRRLRAVRFDPGGRLQAECPLTPAGSVLLRNHAPNSRHASSTNP